MARMYRISSSEITNINLFRGVISLFLKKPVRSYIVNVSDPWIEPFLGRQPGANLSIHSPYNVCTPASPRGVALTSCRITRQGIQVDITSCHRTSSLYLVLLTYLYVSPGRFCGVHIDFLWMCPFIEGTKGFSVGVLRLTLHFF